MELNSKKLERTSRIVYYSISTILCLFLILLSNRIIDDLDTVTVKPEIENFENKTVQTGLDKKISDLNIEIENFNTKKNTIEKTISTAKENYVNEKQSFDNWVQTRKTFGSPDKDREVIDRAKKLDKFYNVEQDWRSQLNVIQTQINEREKNQQEIQKLIDNEKSEAEKQYYKELKQYDLKVFLIRLLFVAPILALGIFFFIRYRRHKFWPLFFGFTLFSFYAFFIGLVPYLPSYGGYVRYAVGIILSAGLGYYAIKTIRQYIEKKQAELKISTQERAKNVQSEVAEKALENHFCPSCGKDFVIKKWEFPFKNNESDAYKLVTDFCRHCGLELFKKCNNCGNKNFAHLPYCSSCGTKPTTPNEPSAKSSAPKIIIAITALIFFGGGYCYSQSAETRAPRYLDKKDPICISIKNRAVKDLIESARRSDPESEENKLIATQIKTWPEERQNALQALFEKSLKDYNDSARFDAATFMLVFSSFGTMDKKRITEEYDIRVQYLGGDNYGAEFWEDGLAVNSEAHALAWAHDLAARYPDDKKLVKDVKKTYADVRKSIKAGKQERYTEVMALLYTAENDGSVTFHDPFQPVINFLNNNSK